MYKIEIDKYKKELEEEDIIIYKNFMKMLEFIDIIKEKKVKRKEENNEYLKKKIQMMKIFKILIQKIIMMKVI